jgi:hypothetical protein
MPDATHYTYRVAWSVEDGEHVATVAEFPAPLLRQESWPIGETRLVQDSKFFEFKIFVLNGPWRFATLQRQAPAGRRLVRVFTCGR